MIERVGGKWHAAYILYSRRGTILGVHRTRREAEAQEVAIQISKARAAGHDVPEIHGVGAASKKTAGRARAARAAR